MKKQNLRNLMSVYNGTEMTSYPISYDVETTTFQKGNPFSRRNRLCSIGLDQTIYDIEYSDTPYGNHLSTIQTRINEASVLVVFNGKFDLHWGRRYGLNFDNVRIWDCQLAQHIIECQIRPMLSLAQSLEYWELPSKPDYILTNYWEKGIDTPDIPWNELEEYNLSDLSNTMLLYQKQLEYLEDKPKLKKLIELDCYDLKVLAEMEWNGLLYDTEKSIKLSEECEDRIKVIYNELTDRVGNVELNWNSGDQVSAVLYGGSISVHGKELKPFVYKDGRETHKLRNVVKTITFPQLVAPLKGTELKKKTKDGHTLYQTGAPVLSRLKARGRVKEIVDLLIELSDLEKMNGTYYKGIPALIAELDWPDNEIHGQLNQCVAITGRLSSSKPNLQNNPPEVDLLFRSRYD